MIKLVVFDVDGTLLSLKDRVLLPSTINSINAMQSNGIKVAIASGRPYFAMDQHLLSKINFDYYICSNGNIIVDKDGTFLYEYQMEDEDVVAISNEFIKNDDSIFFQFTKCSYVYHNYPHCKHIYTTYTGLEDFLYDDSKNRKKHLSENCVQAVAFTSEDKVNSYRKSFPKYAIEYFGDNGYDIYDATINKGTGIKFLYDILHISRENVCAFGDHFNDMEMLKEVGLGIAMGNAVVELKAIADYVTLNSECGGIEHACKKFNLI